MKIWVVEVMVDHEPGWNLGVFSTKEKAQAVADKFNSEDHPFAEAVVCEFTLDEE